MGNIVTIWQRLRSLGLSEHEASIFMALLDSPKTPAEVSRLTGISRSNVYRIVDKMFESGLLQEHITADDKLLAAADPTSLELLVIEQEEKARQQRKEFDDLLPTLETLSHGGQSFGIKIYRGLSGLKQMLWNELQYTDEVLMFSSGPLEKATGKFWAGKFRDEVIRRGIVQRSIQNYGDGTEPLTKRKDYQPHYIPRYLPADVLPIRAELAIHETTVFIYNPWDHSQPLGAEINNPFLASFLRQVFHHYWEIARELTDDDYPPSSKA